MAAAPEVPEGPGYVVDGEWHRAPGELVRKVPGNALRSAFSRLSPGLDWSAFLRGTLAEKMLDTLLSRTIRIPMGSVGVVTKDGLCVRILPPGEQTIPGLLRDLATGDLGAGGVLERALGPERVSLYLVDRRPVPLSFTVESSTGSGTRTLQATTLVSVDADRDALSAFLNEVVGDREALSAEDLYVRFRCGDRARRDRRDPRAPGGRARCGEGRSRRAPGAVLAHRAPVRPRAGAAPHRPPARSGRGAGSCSRRTGPGWSSISALSIRAIRRPRPGRALRSAAARHLGTRPGPTSRRPRASPPWRPR